MTKNYFHEISLQKFAHAVRMISVPPVMVTALLAVLSVQKPAIFRNRMDVLIPILFLGIVPVLAYPFQHISRRFRDGGRRAQRRLAFVFSVIGYTLAALWAFASHVTPQLMLLCLTYFFSVILLTLCNKGLHLRASGHACSVTGPLVLLVYLVSWKLCLPCVACGAMIAWSSLYLRRHTAGELAAGCLVCVLSFLLALAV